MKRFNPIELAHGKLLQPEVQLEPELVRLLQALARMAAREDYEYFCRTGRVLGYDGATEE